MAQSGDGDGVAPSIYARYVLITGVENADTSEVATPCKAFIVDDDPDMAFLIASVIEVANDGLEVAGVAHSGDEAVAQLATSPADVIVLDLRMPGRNGIEVAAEILAESPEQDIVLFSAYLDQPTCDEALGVGVRECVSKERLRELPDIVRRYCHHT